MKISKKGTLQLLPKSRHLEGHENPHCEEKKEGGPHTRERGRTTGSRHLSAATGEVQAKGCKSDKKPNSDFIRLTLWKRGKRKMWIGGGGKVLVRGEVKKFPLQLVAWGNVKKGKPPGVSKKNLRGRKTRIETLV